MATDGLDRLARFGPFFVVQALEPDALVDPAWLPVESLSSDTALLDRRIASVHAALAASAQLDTSAPVLSRVSVSITQLGLSARLIAVALGAAVDGLTVPTVGRLVFQDRLGGPYPLGVLPGPASIDTDRPEWPESVLTLVRPIAAAVLAGGYGLSAKIVRGNLASALAGAAAMLADAEPASGDRARSLVERALLRPELDGTGSFVNDRFRRNSCCLIYRLAEEPIFCGDCVLAAA